MIKYLPSLSDQAALFFQGIGMGFLLGILYDIFRIFRMIVFKKSGRAVLLTFDIIYSIISTVLCFIFFMVINNGIIMSYILFSIIAGWIIYYFTLGALIVKTTALILMIIKKIFRFIDKVIFAPLRWIFKRFHKLLVKIYGFFKKKHKKAVKNSKTHLKSHNRLLYNNRKLLSFKHSEDKKGRVNVKTNKKKKT